MGSTPFKDTGLDLEAYLRQIEGRVRLTEQAVAQQLRAAMGEPTRSGQLFHWRRENGRVGEIDLVLECQTGSCRWRPKAAPPEP